MLLRDKTAIIYGASGAVGGAVAKAFSREGARVVLAARGRAGLEAVAETIRTGGGTAEVMPVDATDREAVEAHLQQAVERFGPVKVMFGAKYLSSTSGVLPIVCAGGGLALLYLLVTYTVAIEDSAWTWMLGLGMVLQFALIALFHRSVTQVAGMQAITVLALLIVNEIWFHPLLPRPHRG